MFLWIFITFILFLLAYLFTAAAVDEFNSGWAGNRAHAKGFLFLSFLAFLGSLAAAYMAG